MNAPSQNPFESPQTAEAPLTGVPTDGSATPRPRSPMVFGVIGLIVGGLNALGGVAGMAAIAAMQNGGVIQQPGMPNSPAAVAYVWAGSILGLVASGLLIAAGVQLVRYRKPGPKLFTIYAFMSILLMIAQVIYTYMTMTSTLDQMAATNPEMAKPEMRSIMVASMTVGALMPLVWLVYPILGMILLNRDSVKEHLA